MCKTLLMHEKLVCVKKLLMNEKLVCVKTILMNEKLVCVTFNECEACVCKNTFNE